MHNFQYSAVDQGLFFHAKFQLNNVQQYNFVYDCGTINSKIDLLGQEIEKYKKDNSNIDLLVISHFDFDHISGIKKLLDQCSTRTVALPYLAHDEILLYFLSNHTIPEEESWYYDFLRDPISFFNQYNSIQKITFIYSHDKDNEFKGNMWFKKVDLPYELSSTIFKTSGQSLEISLLSDQENYKINENLKFKFYNYPITQQKRMTFDRNVLQYLNDNDIDGEINAINFILSSNERTSEFKSQYGFITKNHNNVSLLVSYEYNFSKSRNCSVCIQGTYDKKNSEVKSVEFLNQIIHILTGDISINYKIKHKQIFKHYEEELAQANFIQVPHHGSRYNWNEDLLDKVAKNTCFIISSGNRYRHPHQDVVDTIENSHKLLKANSENRVIGNLY